MNGVLEFIDTSDMTIMNQAEHFMATDVEWDPSGRYVMTAVSWWGHKVDNAYWLWNFQVTTHLHIYFVLLGLTYVSDPICHANVWTESVITTAKRLFVSGHFAA